jgi:hypothetical protein
MNRNRKIVVVSAMCIVALVLATAWTVLAQGDWPPAAYQDCSLTGTWTVTSPQFGPGEFGIASYGPEDPRTGRVAGIVQSLGADPSLGGLAPDGEWVSPQYVTLLRTGPDTFQKTGIFYVMNGATPPAMAAWIFVLNLTAKTTGPDSYEWSGTMSIYSAVAHPGHQFGDLPDQDLDNDGLPDEGQPPILCMPMNGVCHRVDLLPPCEPTPMPGLQQ